MFEGNLLLLKMIVVPASLRGCHLCDALDLFWVWWVTIGWEQAAKECHGVLFDGAFAAVENESFLGYVEQVYDVGIMVSVILPIYEHIIVYGQYSWALGYNVIHSHLENVLAHFESKWYTEKSVPAEVCVECSWGVKLPLSGAFQRMPCCHTLWRIWLLLWVHGLSPWGLVPCDSHGWWLLFKSFRLRHILNLPFAFLGYMRRADPWCGLSLFGDDSLMYHLSQLFLDLLLVLDGNFLSSVLYWKDCKVCFDVVFSQHVTCTQSCWGTTLVRSGAYHLPMSMNDGSDPGMLQRSYWKQCCHLWGEINFMHRAQEHVLVFNGVKCEVKKNSVTFFRTVYDANGAHPDPKKVDAIHKMPPRQQTTTATLSSNGYISLTFHPITLYTHCSTMRTAEKGLSSCGTLHTRKPSTRSRNWSVRVPHSITSTFGNLSLSKLMHQRRDLDQWMWIQAPCRWGWILITFGGGPLEGWSFTGYAVFAVWGSEITWLTSLTGTIYLGLSLLDSFC